MKLTLRKANAVQNSINEAIKGLDIVTNVKLNEFEGVADQIQVARDAFWAANTTRDKLTVALYEIRAKVAAANASADVNDMLTRAACLDKRIVRYNTLASKGPQTAMRVLNGQLQKNAEASGEAAYYRSVEVVTSIFTEAEIDGFKENVKTAKREKQKLQDQLLELNVKTEIVLTRSAVDSLTDAGIL